MPEQRRGLHRTDEQGRPWPLRGIGGDGARRVHRHGLLGAQEDPAAEAPGGDRRDHRLVLGHDAHRAHLVPEGKARQRPVPRPTAHLGSRRPAKTALPLGGARRGEQGHPRAQGGTQGSTDKGRKGTHRRMGAEEDGERGDPAADHGTEQAHHTQAQVEVERAAEAESQNPLQAFPEAGAGI